MRSLFRVLGLLFLATQAVAAPKVFQPSGEKLLSDAWYTVTINRKFHYGYFNDRVSLRSGKLCYQNHYWKKEEDFINEEQIGAYAEDTPELTPLFFNFHSTYRATETTVDGNVSNNQMTLKVQKAGQDLPVIHRDITGKLFLEIFFPLWVKRNESILTTGKSVSYRTFFEDAIDDGFTPVQGRIKSEKEDAFAIKTHSRKYSVEVKGLKSFWWFDGQGIPLRIEMPEQGAVTERVTAEQARGFF